MPGWSPKAEEGYGLHTVDMQAGGAHGVRAAAFAAGAVAATLVAVTATPAAADPAGAVKFERHARSDFMPFLTDSTSDQRTWMRNTYSRMQSYSPWFDSSIYWAPPSYFYLDLYALYRDHPEDQALMKQHPGWALRDSAGNNLYIPFGCSGGTCPQYAADIGNPEWRAAWIEEARSHMAQGYPGVFVDDVNLEMMVSDGNGNLVAPVDPRTGQAMTAANWRRYMAEFTEEIRAAFPNKEIVHNALWWMDHNDPYVQREVAAADYIEMERGFNDSGLTGGTGQWSYETYLSHIDWLHSLGAGVVLEPYDLDAQSATFELASYLLVSEGNDSIASEYHAEPDDWWSGWSTDLGTPNSGRWQWKGLLRRDFSGGMVLVNEPDAAPVSVKLPRRVWTDASGTHVRRRITLGERSAVVLVKGPRRGKHKKH